MSFAYPLSAVAHQPQLLLALSLVAVCPDIGGVLIRGDKGSAKSTAARGLARLLPSGGPFVNLPLGATEDRVVGTLDLEAALRGEAKLRPGLMAQAHGGLLYIDEVNLLPDHLVDVLLDAAAMGVVRVQRDSLSAESPARFALIGSMNPEEGQLRPQFLDRFGLCVDVLAPSNVPQRVDILRRRMAFEADPAGFEAQWREQEQQLREQFRRAAATWSEVEVPETLLEQISELVSQSGVSSLRADLALHRAARAYAALQGRQMAEWPDVQAVAPLVLRHRADPRQPHSPLPPPQPPQPQTGSQEEPAADDSAGTPPEEVFAPAPAAPLTLRPRAQTGAQAGGGHSARLIRTVADPDPSRLHWPATLQEAARRAGEFMLSRDDFRAPIHEEAGGRRVLFVVDASGSVGVAGRMGALKGAVLDVLAAQGSRDRVALITFRSTGAELRLDWTNDAQAAEHAIREAPTGGRTPLAHALQLAGTVLRPQPAAELVLFTDGRTNVPLGPGSDAWTDALTQARLLRRYPTTIVDTESGHIRLHRAAQLAQAIGGSVQALQPV